MKRNEAIYLSEFKINVNKIDVHVEEIVSYFRSQGFTVNTISGNLSALSLPPPQSKERSKQLRCILHFVHFLFNKGSSSFISATNEKLISLVQNSLLFVV